jgi:hypothetical protein
MYFPKLSLTAGATATGTVVFNGHLISAVHPSSPSEFGFAIGWWILAVATFVFTLMALAQLVRRPRTLRP